MKFVKKQWIFSVIGLLVISIGCYFFFAQRPAEVNESPRSVQVKGATELEHLEMKFPGSDDGGYWDFKLVRLIDQQDHGVMVEVVGHYMLNGNQTHQITANGGKVIWETGELAFEGQVELKTVEGYRLTADKLSWNPDNQLLIANGNVWLRDEDLTIETEQLTATSNFKKIEFSGVTRVISMK